MSSAKDDPEEFDLRQRIVGLMEEGAVAPLLEAHLGYLQKFPESGWGWLVSVPTLIDLGRYGDAKAALKSARLFNSDEALPTLCYWRSILYKEKGDLRRAERWIREALEVEPNNGSFQVTLGDILAKRGKLKAARKAHLAAVELGDANVDEAHFNLALLLRAQRRYDEALVQVNAALSIDPDYSDAYALKQDLEAVQQGDWSP